MSALALVGKAAQYIANRITGKTPCLHQDEHGFYVPWDSIAIDYDIAEGLVTLTLLNGDHVVAKNEDRVLLAGAGVFRIEGLDGRFRVHID